MNTKCLAWVAVLVVAIGLLAGCARGQAEPVASEAAPGGGEGAEQAEAATTPGTPAGGGTFFVPAGGMYGEVNQLALGTLYLQSTEYAVTAEQAAILLPLWNELKTLQETEDVDQDQIDGVVSQINEAMTVEQQSLLSNLAQEDLFAWMQEEGLPGGFGPPRGDGTPQGPPQMSEEEWATAQAAHTPGPPPMSEEEMATAQAAHGEGRGPGGRYPDTFIVSRNLSTR
jgi:hypothetical protein